MKAYISHFYYYKNVLIEKMPYARRAYGILMSGKNHEQRPKRTFSSYFPENFPSKYRLKKVPTFALSFADTPKEGWKQGTDIVRRRLLEASYLLQFKLRKLDQVEDEATVDARGICIYMLPVPARVQERILHIQYRHGLSSLLILLERQCEGLN